VLDFNTTNSSSSSNTVTTAATTGAAASVTTAASTTLTLYSGSSSYPPVLSVQAAQHTSNTASTASASATTVTVGPRNGSSYREHSLLTDGWTGPPRVLSWQWPMACHSSDRCSTSYSMTRCSARCGNVVGVALAGWSDGCIDVVPVHTTADSAGATTGATAVGTYYAYYTQLTICYSCMLYR
jgi:hypothetical protein